MRKLGKIQYTLEVEGVVGVDMYPEQRLTKIGENL